MVSLNVVFPLAVTGQLVSNLGFTFEAETNIRFVAVLASVVRELVTCVNFTVQVKFVAVFVVDFCCISCTSY
ncbi:Uncharacterised protein [Yersinia enterocolitica]|nr:Uncharacterised protein [Yersinia enterocolitica]